MIGGVALIAVLWSRNGPSGAGDDLVPMDVEWTDGAGFATLADGRIVRLSLDGDAVRVDDLTDGLSFPRGLAVTDDAIYVAELGDLPCENPVPRCKGEQVGPTVADGERALLASTAGRILAYPRTDDGGVGEPSVLLDGLSFVNTDHGLNDLELGPDGQLYLSIGNFDRLAWDDVTDLPDGPETELLGSVIRIDPASGETSVFARGFRNVYGLSFDKDGSLWGVDNDGRGQGAWRFEELEHISEGLDFGFPDDGTIGPYERRTGFATWLLRSGAGSAGLLVRHDVVLSGGCGKITRLGLDPEGGDAELDEVDHRGCVTAIAELPDGRLLLATVLGERGLQVTTEAELFGD